MLCTVTVSTNKIKEYVVFIKYIRFINRVLIEEKPVNNLVDGFVFVKKYLRVLFEFNFFE